MPNSRLHPRARFFAEVDALTPTDDMPRRMWGQDLCEAGMFLQTTQPLRPGARLSLRFDVEAAEVHVRAAEVVWVRPFEPINVDGTQPGVGIRFLSVDPTARAAIRRFVREAQTPSGPPADSLPPLPERLSLIDETPPPAPPASGDLSGPSELGPLRALSLPPVTFPPVPSLPRSPEQTPAAVVEPAHPPTRIPPAVHAAAGAPAEAAHPLSGWRFEVLPEPSAAEAVPQAAAREPPCRVEEPTNPFRLSLAFDDSGPAEPVRRAQTDGDAMAAERFTTSLPLCSDTPSSSEEVVKGRESLTEAFFEGRIAPLELPEAAPRRGARHAPDPRAARRRSYGVAAALLAVGAAAGLALSLGPVPEPREGVKEDAAAHGEPASAGHASPKPVFVAERPLLEEPAAGASLAAKPPSTREAPGGKGDEAPLPRGVRAEAKAPVAPPAAKASPSLSSEPTLASTLPVARAEPTPEGVHVEWGRVTVPLEGGQVARTFTLEGPPRVVVDLTGARYPGAKNETVGEKGVARLRIGRPDPRHVRVVVELEPGRAAKAPSVLKRSGSLAIAWR